MKTLTILPVNPQQTLTVESRRLTNSCLFIKTSDTIYRIEKASIIYLQAQGNYTFIYTAKGKLCSSKTLKVYGNLLKDRFFIRPHQSFMINMNHIDQIHYDARNAIIMKSGEHIPISRSKKAALLEAFQNY